jgi:hypothetical protein
MVPSTSPADHCFKLPRFHERQRKSGMRNNADTLVCIANASSIPDHMGDNANTAMDANMKNVWTGSN